MIDHFYSQPKVLKRLHSGPLGSYIDSFAQILIVQGYQTSTAKHKIRIVADLSRWLEQQGLRVKDLDETTLNKYLLYKGRRGSIFKIEPPTLRALLEHLRETGVVADSVQVDDDSKRSLNGMNVDRHMPQLSTYLGHAHVTDTYWYLSAVPELMQLAAMRLKQTQKGMLP